MKKLNTSLRGVSVRHWFMSISMIFIFSLCHANNVETSPSWASDVLPTGSEVTRNIPIDAVFYNPCCDEEVHLSGTAMFVVNENIIHVVVSDLTGTGLSTGYSYKGRGPSVETNVFYSNQNEGTFTFILRMTNEDGCSFSLKATFHIEMNANGEITVAFEKVDVKCN